MPRTTLTCYDVVVSKILVVFLSKRLPDTGDIIIQHIPQRFNNLGDGEIEPSFVSVGA